MRAPAFWDAAATGPWPVLLSPLSAAWRLGGALRRLATTPARAPVPVICVGNLVAGGAGKTPVVAAVVDTLRSLGARPHVLTRGFGGRLRGPVRVDPDRHTWREVGDEPLLHARQAPTWVARDRAAGARAAAAEGAEGGADVVVMDDGLQNPGLAKDLSLLVVDGGFGFGNGRVMPAGPLREPLRQGLARADAVVLIGEDRRGVAARIPGEMGPPIRARLVPRPEAEVLTGRKVVAFAGIGRPEKFFATLEEIGAEVVARHGFADHHPYTPDEVMRLVEDATDADAVPVTTEKDHVRLPDDAKAMVTVLPVALEWARPEAIEDLLRSLL